MEKYVFRKYTSEYRVFFISEKNKIAKTIGSRVKIEHIGSTAISNLGGKGILDIAVGVSKSEIAKAKKKLEKAGYEFREKASNHGRLFFRIDYSYKKGKRRVHIHLVKFNAQDWQEMIGFRNYLLEHSEVVEQYIKIKKQAVKKALGDGEKYRECKERFIQDVLKKVLKNAISGSN